MPPHCILKYFFLLPSQKIDVACLAVMTDTDESDSAMGSTSLARASLAHFTKPGLKTSGAGGEKREDIVAILVQTYVPSTKAANCLNI